MRQERGDNRQTEDVSKRGNAEGKYIVKEVIEQSEWDCSSSDVTDSLERFSPSLSLIFSTGG